MKEPLADQAAPLIRNAGPLWEQATRSPFLDALAAGTLPAKAFQLWLSQDYLFAKGLTAFQAITLAKVPRDCHKPLVSGLAALDREMEWFEEHARRLHLDLETPPHRTCQKYMDFLMRCAYTQSHPVLLAVLFGVEVSYLAAWSALEARGPYAEFIERWSNPAFVKYVEALRALAEGYPHPEAQSYFEAAALAGISVRDLQSMEEAAKRIADLGPRAMLIKGGHLTDDAVDLLYYQGRPRRFIARRMPSKNTHGTGCTYSAAITAELAKGRDLEAAIETAKRFITRAIAGNPGLGKGCGPVDHHAPIE